MAELVQALTHGKTERLVGLETRLDGTSASILINDEHAQGLNGFEHLFAGLVAISLLEKAIEAVGGLAFEAECALAHCCLPKLMP